MDPSFKRTPARGCVAQILTPLSRTYPGTFSHTYVCACVYGDAIDVWRRLRVGLIVCRRHWRWGRQSFRSGLVRRRLGTRRDSLIHHHRCLILADRHKSTPPSTGAAAEALSGGQGCFGLDIDGHGALYVLPRQLEDVVVQAPTVVTLFEQ